MKYTPKNSLRSLANDLGNSLKYAVLGLILASGAVFSAAVPTLALAATPTISAYSTSNSTIQLTVQGDQNQTVNLYYYSPGSTVTNYAGSIGTTNSSGYFSTTLNASSYNIPAGANVYVIVNGQQSSIVAWPSATGGNVYLSQSNITLNQGQSATISISGGAGNLNGNGYFVSSNSNSNVVTASVAGSILTLYAQSGGYSVLSICSTTTYYGCSSLTVNVNGGYNNGGTYYGSSYVTLSPSSVSVIAGQSQQVTAYAYNGYGSTYGQSFYISSNTGTQYYTASVSGNTVTINGTYPGSGTVYVCQYNGSACATLYVTVTSNYNYNNGYNGYCTQSYPYTCCTNGYNYNYGYGNSCYNSYNNGGTYYGNGYYPYGNYGYPVSGSFYNYTNYGSSYSYPYSTYPHYGTGGGFQRTW